MIEKIKKVSNPLTIIAIFAGLAEVSGTIVLPFLKDSSQDIYVWFLIVFPTILIFLFFFTLNCNHKVLYAPSDFQDEDNFLKLFRKPNAGDRLEKLNSEIEAESKATGHIQEEHLSTVDSAYRDIIRRSSASTHYLAEELVITKLSPEFDEIEKEVMLKSEKSQFLFDAIGKKNANVFAIEVKYIKDSKSLKNLKSSLVKIQRTFQELPEIKGGKMTLLLAIATDLEGKELEQFAKDVEASSTTFIFPQQVRVFNLKSLENELIGV
jgi:hypothetical protein